MNNEIVKWYSERHYPPRRVINRGRRRRIPAYYIREAMKHCYQKIQDGKEISDIEIGRYVFNVAKDIQSKKVDSRFSEEELYTLRMKGLIYPTYAIIFLLTVTFFSYKIWWC